MNSQNQSRLCNTNTSHAASQSFPFVFKSDVKDFYQSIDHCQLLNQLKSKGVEQNLILLIEQFLNHTEEYGGLYVTVRLTTGLHKSRFWRCS